MSNIAPSCLMLARSSGDKNPRSVLRFYLFQFGFNIILIYMGLVLNYSTYWQLNFKQHCFKLIRFNNNMASM